MTHALERAFDAASRLAERDQDDLAAAILAEIAMPIAWRGTLVQYAGRLQRAHAGKLNVHVYDYVDRAIPVLARMFEKRLRGYRAMGYQIEP